MDGIVDSLEKAYKEFVTAAAIVLETRETNGGEKEEDVGPSLKKFKESLVLFKDSCDEAQGYVMYLKHSLGCRKFPGNMAYSPEQVLDDGGHNDSLIQCNPIPIKADDEKTETLIQCNPISIKADDETTETFIQSNLIAIKVDDEKTETLIQSNPISIKTDDDEKTETNMSTSKF